MYIEVVYIDENMRRHKRLLPLGTFMVHEESNGDATIIQADGTQWLCAESFKLVKEKINYAIQVQLNAGDYSSDLFREGK